MDLFTRNCEATDRARPRARQRDRSCRSIFFHCNTESPQTNSRVSPAFAIGILLRPRTARSSESEFAKCFGSANRILMNFFVQRSELRDLYDKVAAGERI